MTSQPDISTENFQSDISPLYESDIQDFINDAEKENTQPVFSLYRIEELAGGAKKQKEQFLCSFDFPPDPEWIQKTYCVGNDGSFRVVGNYSNKTGKRIRKYKTFHIAGIEAPPIVQATPPAGSPELGNNSALITIMQEQNRSLYGLLNVVLASALSGNNAAPAPAADPLKLQNTIGEIIRSSAENQMEVINNMVSHKANAMLPGSQEPEESPGFMVEFISGLLEKWGGSILNGTKTEQKFFKKMAQKAPEFQMMEKNPADYAVAYKEMLNRGVEQGNLDAIIDVLGAPKPDLELVND